MRSFLSLLLVAMLAVGPWNLSASAASAKSLGVVVQAKSAHLDFAEAAMGATVYSGDAMDTDEGGALRFRVGSSQIYLTPVSAASVEEVANVAHITMVKGTVGFSTTSPDQLELETPAGILRGTPGQTAFGQATILGPQEMLIYAYRGNIVLDNDGEFHIIPEGKAYRVTISDEVSATSSDDQPIKVHRKKRRKLAFILIAGGAAAAGLLLWHNIYPSPSTPE